MALGLKEAFLVGLAFLLWKTSSGAAPKPSTKPSEPAAKKPADVKWPTDQPPLPTPPEPIAPPKPPSPPAESPGRKVPPGYDKVRFTTGLRGEDAVVYEYPNGDQYVLPLDEKLAGYRIPGGSKDVP